MRARVTFLLACGFAWSGLALASAACGNGAVTPGAPADAAPIEMPDTSLPDGGDDSTPTDASPEASSDATPDGDGAADVHDGRATGLAYVRFAQLASGAPPFDICLAKQVGGTADFSQSRPLLGMGAPTGLTFAQVTKFAQLEAATWVARLVAPSALDCSTALVLQTFAPVVIADGDYVTVLTAGTYPGDAGPTAFNLTSRVDDGPTTAILDGGTGAALRVVHEAPGIGTLDLGKGSLTSGDYSALFTSLAYGGTSPAGGSIDARGYLVPALVNGDIVSAHLQGQTTDLASWSNVTVDVGQVATLFLVPGTTPGSLGALLCARDYPAVAMGPLNTTCALLQ